MTSDFRLYFWLLTCYNKYIKNKYSILDNARYQ
jgi:hypothetical protein